MSGLRVVYMATPDISVPVLEFLADSKDVSDLLVLSMPDRPAGRGRKLTSPDVITRSKELSIPFIQSENINKDQDAFKQIEAFSPDMIVVFAFAQFLGSKVLNLPKLGCFNIHTSLLPKYRGAAPIQYALLNGDSQTGISIQKMVKKMDAGDVAESMVVNIDPIDHGASLYEKLKQLAPKVLEKLINNIQNDCLSFTQQDETQVTFAPTIKKSDGEIFFKNISSNRLVNKVRGFYPWPGTFFIFNNKRVKILAAVTDKLKLPPGKVSTELNMIRVGTSDGFSVRLTSLQMEGKKPSDEASFIGSYFKSSDEMELS